MRWGGDPNEGSPWSAHKRYQLCNSSIRLFITRWPYIVTSLKALNEREGVGGVGEIGERRKGYHGCVVVESYPPRPNAESNVCGGWTEYGLEETSENSVTTKCILFLRMGPVSGWGWRGTHKTHLNNNEMNEWGICSDERTHLSVNCVACDGFDSIPGTMDRSSRGRRYHACKSGSRCIIFTSA